MKKINWGIIGLGHIANQFAKAFSMVGNAKIKGIASLDKDKLRVYPKGSAPIDARSDKFALNNFF